MPFVAVEKAAISGAKALVVAGLWLLLFFAFATMIDGATRAIVGKPIDVVRDVGGLIVAISITACLPWAFLDRQNIAITFIDALIGRRMAEMLTAVAAVATLIVMIVFAWQFFLHAGNLARAGDVTAMMAWPKAVFWYVVDGLLWLTVAVQILVVIRGFITFIRPNQECEAVHSARGE